MKAPDELRAEVTKKLLDGVTPMTPERVREVRERLRHEPLVPPAGNLACHLDIAAACAAELVDLTDAAVARVVTAERTATARVTAVERELETLRTQLAEALRIHALKSETWDRERALTAKAYAEAQRERDEAREELAEANECAAVAQELAKAEKARVREAEARLARVVDLLCSECSAVFRHTAKLAPKPEPAPLPCCRHNDDPDRCPICHPHLRPTPPQHEPPDGPCMDPRCAEWRADMARVNDEAERSNDALRAERDDLQRRLDGCVANLATSLGDIERLTNALEFAIRHTPDPDELIGSERETMQWAEASIKAGKTRLTFLPEAIAAARAPNGGGGDNG